MPHPAPIQTAAVLASYLASARDNGCRPSTLRRYRTLAKALIRASRTVPTTPEQMARLTGNLRRHYSPNTVNVALTVLTSAIRHSDLGAELPKVKARKVKVQRPLPVVLDAAAQDRLLSAVAGTRLELAVLLALDAGLRTGEIVRLQWIDLCTGTSTVRVRDPKNYQDREIPMTGRLQRAAEAAELRVREAGGPAVAWCFPSAGGDRVAGAPRREKSPGHILTLGNAIDRAHAKAHTGHTGWHILRRTWATKLGELAPLPVLMRLGGWSNLAVVGRYVTSRKAAELDAIAALDAATATKEASDASE